MASGEPEVIHHGGDDSRNHVIDFRLLNIHPEGAAVSRGCDRVFAVVIIPGLFVLAVRFRDVAIQTLAAAGTFQNTGQNVRVFRVIDFFTPVCVFLSFLMG